MKLFFHICFLGLLATSALCAKLGSVDADEDFLKPALERAEELTNHKRDGNDNNPTPQETHNKERALHMSENEKRGKTRRGINAVSKATIYRPDGSTYEATVQEMCLYAHNHVRQQHTDTPDLTWDPALASGCEAYAKILVKDGVLVHSKESMNGDFGENLYVGSNTYNAESTPSHAVYSWYSESWDPNPEDNKIQFYNYKFNPTTTSDFKNAGVGHFSATVWKDTKQVGCGVASTTYSSGGSQWTRTVVVARYLPAGNMLNKFPASVMPLKNGDKSLKGEIRVGDCLPSLTSKDAADCKDRIPPGTCGSFQNSGFCMIVEHDCNCECAPSS